MRGPSCTIHRSLISRINGRVITVKENTVSLQKNHNREYAAPSLEVNLARLVFPLSLPHEARTQYHEQVDINLAVTDWPVPAD